MTPKQGVNMGPEFFDRYIKTILEDEIVRKCKEQEHQEKNEALLKTLRKVPINSFLMGSKVKV